MGYEKSLLSPYQQLTDILWLERGIERDNEREGSWKRGKEGGREKVARDREVKAGGDVSKSLY